MDTRLAFLGPWELGAVLVLALLLFGPRNLPKIGKSLGEGLREFRQATSRKGEDEAAEKDGQEPPTS